MDTDTDTNTDTNDGAVLALRLIPPQSWEMGFTLAKIALDPRAFKKNLRALHDSLRAEAEAQKKTCDERTAFEEWAATERAEIAEEKAAATKRLLAAQEAERVLEEKQKPYAEMAKRWNDLALPGEPPEMMFGTLSRAKPYSGYQKAKHFAEHGSLPLHPDAPLPTAEPAQSREEPASTNTIRRGHGDATDWPSNVSLTRAPDESEQQRVAVRVRSRKGAQATS